MAFFHFSSTIRTLLNSLARTMGPTSNVGFGMRNAGSDQDRAVSDHAALYLPLFGRALGSIWPTVSVTPPQGEETKGQDGATAVPMAIGECCQLCCLVFYCLVLFCCCCLISTCFSFFMTDFDRLISDEQIQRDRPKLFSMHLLHHLLRRFPSSPKPRVVVRKEGNLKKQRPSFPLLPRNLVDQPAYHAHQLKIPLPLVMEMPPPPTWKCPPTLMKNARRLMILTYPDKLEKRLPTKVQEESVCTGTLCSMWAHHRHRPHRPAMVLRRKRR